MNNYSKECQRLEILSKHKCSENFNFYILFHVYYKEEIDTILKLMEEIEYNFFLIITIVGTKNLSIYKAFSMYENEYLRVIYLDNNGYDILPFLKVLSEVQGDDSIVAKIHTKPNQSIVGNKWRNECLKSILHSNLYVSNVLNLFNEDQDLGMLGSSKLYKDTKKFMYGNQIHFSFLLKILNSDYDINCGKPSGFFAGTMFWSRKKIFNKLLPLLLKIEDFSKDNIDNNNVSIWHAIERLFGIFPMLESQKIFTVNFSNEQTFDFSKSSNPSLIPLTQSF